MKKYADYIYEGLNSQEYTDSYNTISNELKTFWVNLEQEIKKLTPNKEPVSNTETPTTVKPDTSNTNGNFKAPIKGETYKYNTQTGKVETVKILVSDNGQNTNTSIVQNINKPGRTGQHTANWSRLVPISKTT